MQKFQLEIIGIINFMFLFKELVFRADTLASEQVQYNRNRLVIDVCTLRLHYSVKVGYYIEVCLAFSVVGYNRYSGEIKYSIE